MLIFSIFRQIVDLCNEKGGILPYRFQEIGRLIDDNFNQLRQRHALPDKVALNDVTELCKRNAASEFRIILSHNVSTTSCAARISNLVLRSMLLLMSLNKVDAMPYAFVAGRDFLFCCADIRIGLYPLKQCAQRLGLLVSR